MKREIDNTKLENELDDALNPILPSRDFINELTLTVFVNSTEFATEIHVLFKAFLVERTSLIAENMALRRELTVVQRSVKRPKLRKAEHFRYCHQARARLSLDRNSPSRVAAY